MDENKRIIIIELSTKNIKRGKIPVSLISNTLRSVQVVAYQLGNSRIEREPSIPGPYSAMLKRELELFFMKAEPGSLTATIELAEKEATLFPDFPDFAEKVIEDMHYVIKGIKEEKSDLIQKYIPYPAYRKRILTELNQILPPKKADYEVAFKFGEFPSIPNIERPTDAQIQAYVGHFKEEIKGKPKEAIINARCLARLKEDGSVDKIVDILNYELFEEVDLRPFRTLEIQWQNRKFILRKELACDVRKEDSIIIIEYEPLKIRVFNFSREEAISDFSEEFAFLWDNYVLESDKKLTQDAISLKNTIKSLVERIEKI